MSSFSGISSVCPPSWPLPVTQSVQDYCRQCCDDVQNISPVAFSWAQELEAFVCAGGKRIRPTFVWLGWRAAGGDADNTAMIRVAAAVEFVHASALLHDDIIDGSDTRRGRPSAHQVFAANLESRRGEGKAVGSSAEYGLASAMLLGDLALSWADDMMVSSGISAEALGRALPYWSAMKTEMLSGQFLDIHGETWPQPNRTASQQVNRYKTAAYTVERPLHVGAACAGASKSLLQMMSVYGQSVGTAFQLRDDVLGAYGDSAVTGKPSGDDLSEGKRTVLLSYALEGLDPAEREELWSLVGQPLSEDEVGRARVLLDCSGAVQRVEEDIAQLSQQARQVVELMRSNEYGLSADCADALEEMITVLVERDF